MRKIEWNRKILLKIQIFKVPIRMGNFCTKTPRPQSAYSVRNTGYRKQAETGFLFLIFTNMKLF